MDVKISELPESEGLKAGCCFPVVTDEVTYKVTFQQIKSQILDAVYPVGSIWISVNATNPGEVFGGSWERIQGKFLLGASSDYAAGSEGGEATHVLTKDEIPHLGSGVGYGGNAIASGNGWADHWLGGDDLPVAHNNMPPYVSVYMWKRIF